MIELEMDRQPDIVIKSIEIPKIVGNLGCRGLPNFMVECHGGKVECYRKILATFSSIFKSVERGVTSAHLYDVPVELFAIIVRFYQSGECTVKRKDLDALGQTVEKLGFKELQETLNKVTRSENPGILAITGLVHDGLEESDEEELLEEKMNEIVKDEEDGVQVPCVSMESGSDSENSRPAEGNMNERRGPSPIPGPSTLQTDSTAKAEKTPKKKWTKEELDALMDILKTFHIKFDDDDEDGASKLRGKMKYISLAMKAKGFGGDIRRIYNKICYVKNKAESKKKEKAQKEAASDPDGVLSSREKNLKRNSFILTKRLKQFRDLEKL